VRVDFLVNGSVVGSDGSAPYSMAWTAAADGVYALAALATDNAGLTGRSADIRITVGDSGPDGLPPGWASQDIGSVGVAGATSAGAGSVTLSGAGADIWGTADAFRFAYRALDGDGSITARVVSVENTDVWAKAGVMIRESLSAGSRHATMFVASGKGLAFQRRTSTAGTSSSTAGPLLAAPRWVRITRAGTTFTAAWSTDGAVWNGAGSATIAMTSSVLIGLAVTSHNNATLADAVFDQITVETATPTPPTDSWTHQDIGAVGLAGGASQSGGVFEVRGAGADIWGTADAFHFLYKRVTGDGELIARVTSVSNTNAWAKSGVMIRETTSSGSRHATMFSSAGRGLAFQRRPTTGGTSVSTAGALNPPPMWVRLVRAGSTFTASQSVDGVTWTVVGAQTITMPAEALWGLAVTSHNTGAVATGVFDNVTVP
jgi:regulation of enolase protein 1 (concanavalin A-like superfamily)